MVIFHGYVSLPEATSNGFSLWLWLTDIANWKPWPIEIDGLPNSKMVIFQKMTEFVSWDDEWNSQLNGKS